MIEAGKRARRQLRQREVCNVDDGAKRGIYIIARLADIYDHFVVIGEIPRLSESQGEVVVVIDKCLGLDISEQSQQREQPQPGAAKKSFSVHNGSLRSDDLNHSAEVIGGPGRSWVRSASRACRPNESSWRHPNFGKSQWAPPAYRTPPGPEWWPCSSDR